MAAQSGGQGEDGGRPPAQEQDGSTEPLWSLLGKSGFHLHVSLPLREASFSERLRGFPAPSRTLSRSSRQRGRLGSSGHAPVLGQATVRSRLAGESSWPAPTACPAVDVSARYEVQRGTREPVQPLTRSKGKQMLIRQAQSLWKGALLFYIEKF